MGGSVVGGVEVVGLSGVLGGDSVDALDEGSETESLTVRADLVLLGVSELGDLSVRETTLLGELHEVLVDGRERAELLKLTVDLNNVVELVQEESVDLVSSWSFSTS